MNNIEFRAVLKTLKPGARVTMFITKANPTLDSNDFDMAVWDPNGTKNRSEHQCLWCAATFIAANNAKFCSPAHRIKAHRAAQRAQM